MYSSTTQLYPSKSKYNTSLLEYKQTRKVQVYSSTTSTIQLYSTQVQAGTIQVNSNTTKYNTSTLKYKQVQYNIQIKDFDTNAL